MTMVIKVDTTLRERKKAATRRRIIATAVRIFGERGIDEPTVDEIAAAADVGKGTIYNYFATKEDMVVAFMVDLEYQVQSKAGRFAESTGPLERILASYLRLQFRLKEPFHNFVRVFLGQMFARGNSFYPHMVELQKSIDPPLEHLFHRLVERRLIRDDTNIEDLVVIFKTMHLGLAAMWAFEGPPWRQTKRLLKEEMKLFCKGIGEK